MPQQIAKIYYFAIVMLCICNLSLAQDVHYSQRIAGDRQNNPSFTNKFKGNWQAMTVYRNQWQSIGVPFTSSSLFFTKQFTTSDPALTWFGGLIYTNDKSGDAKLSMNHIGLNVGANYILNEDEFTFAFTNSFTAKRFDQSGLTFPEQYDRNIGGFNERLGSGENFQGEQLNYYDLGFGLTWQREVFENWKLTSGFSMLHLLEPKESFFETDNKKNRGYGIQLLAEHSLVSNIQLFPYLSYYRAGKASETLIGSSILFNTSSFGPIENIKPFLYLRTGISRLNDAVIIGSQADVGNFQIGASYDFNISELEIASNYQGGFEITLIYTAKDLQLTKRRISCERY